MDGNYKFFKRSAEKLPSLRGVGGVFMRSGGLYNFLLKRLCVLLRGT